MTDEIPLTGGNVAADVVRVADTVRKPATPFDAATSALLRHLEAKTVTGVPCDLGTDDNGRRILSWVAGSTDFPTHMWDNEITLMTAAKQLRTYHDASATMVGQPHIWAYTYPDETLHEVICHNDFAPYNMTFDDTGAVIGVFDFDLAGPGPRTRDLAYLAWWLVPLGQLDNDMGSATQADVANGSKRLIRLCATYGIMPDAAFLDMISHVLHHMSDPAAAAAMIGETAAHKLAADGHLNQWAQARDDFAGLRPHLTANLGL